jgi:HEAT repeat protein
MGLVSVPRTERFSEMWPTKRLLLLCCFLACAGCGKGSTADWVEKLKAPKEMTRIQAVRTLVGRKEDAEQVIPALIGALKDENVYVRRDAARGLGAFGERARDAIPALRESLRDREPSVRKAASLALGHIDPKLGAQAPPGK